MKTSFTFKLFARHAGIVLILFLTGVLLTACNQPQNPPNTTATPDVNLLETLVATQMTAVAAQTGTAQPATPTSPAIQSSPTAAPSATLMLTATPVPTATPLPENVSGKVCFPGGDVPAMTAYFENTDSHQVIELPVQAGQNGYKINLPSGTYIAYAWLDDFSRGGLYSQAVPCGLKSNCEDHQPLNFTVKASEQLEGIDLCDWYAGPFNVPYPPGKEINQMTGGISGSLSYPGGSTPQLNVFAFNVQTHNWYYVQTNAGWSAYRLDDLPPGVYQVVAYNEQGDAGGYTDANHNPIDITVKAGEIADGADINDWNAPGGTFPPNPIR